MDLPFETGFPMDLPRRPRKRRALRVAAAAATIAALAAGGVALARLRPAAPAIDREGLFIGEVRRGAMTKAVQGWGALVPEETRWVTAVDAARVERILLRAGQQVEPDTVVAELANPEIELGALEADRQVAAAEGELVALESSATRDETERRAALVTLKGSLATAAARATADQDLATRGYLGALERAVSETERATLAARAALEEGRAGALGEACRRRLASQRRQLAQLTEMARFRKRQLAALRVRAGAAGVVQEISVEPGQWVTPGTVLAKVADPRALKAVVKIAEAAARDLAVGQSAQVDTQNGVVAARVARVAPKVQEGTVAVDLALVAAPPPGARPDLAVVGTIELERLGDVLYVERPNGAQAHAPVKLFRLTPRGDQAVRVEARFGQLSATTVEVTAGLAAGDRVILSDSSAFIAAERLRLR